MEVFIFFPLTLDANNPESWGFAKHRGRKALRLWNGWFYLFSQLPPVWWWPSCYYCCALWKGRISWRTHSWLQKLPQSISRDERTDWTDLVDELLHGHDLHILCGNSNLAKISTIQSIPSPPRSVSVIIGLNSVICPIGCGRPNKMSRTVCRRWWRFENARREDNSIPLKAIRRKIDFWGPSLKSTTAVVPDMIFDPKTLSSAHIVESVVPSRDFSKLKTKNVKPLSIWMKWLHYRR